MPSLIFSSLLEEMLGKILNSAPNCNINFHMLLFLSHIFKFHFTFKFHFASENGEQMNEHGLF
jgi:hypothetical protein